jgi:PA14 domain
MTSPIATLSRGGLAAIGMALMLAPASAGAQMLDPAEPQPDPAQLQPGLAVCYMYDFVRHIDQMIYWEESNPCEPGPPLLELNYFSGEGKVLTSKANDGVMARITGFIHLEEPGMYTFGFESNDGVRLEIGDYQVLEDPDVHSDRYSDLGQIYANAAGWYPITIRYFERKSTSTLRFYMLPPGGEPGTLPLVPGEILAHLPDNPPA